MRNYSTVKLCLFIVGTLFITSAYSESSTKTVTATGTVIKSARCTMTVPDKSLSGKDWSGYDKDSKLEIVMHCISSRPDPETEANDNPDSNKSDEVKYNIVADHLPGNESNPVVTGAGANHTVDIAKLIQSSKTVKKVAQNMPQSTRPTNNGIRMYGAIIPVTVTF